MLTRKAETRVVSFGSCPRVRGPISVQSTRRSQRVVTSEDQGQERTEILNPKAKMANKENVNRLPGSKNNTIVGKKYISLKASNELTNSTVIIDTHKCEDNNKILRLLPNDDNLQSQRMTLSQVFHLKNNSKKKQITEKPKQDANMPKKLVLRSYRGQIVQSKVNSFRKPLQVKDESSVATKKLSSIPKATKPQPTNSSVTVKSDRGSNITAPTKSVSTTSQNTQLVRPPIRSHHDNTQDARKQAFSRTSGNITTRKGPCGKELLQSKPILSNIKTSSSQDIKRNGALSRNTASETIDRSAFSSNSKLIEKPKSTHQRRYTTANATVDNRSSRPKETSEERKACLSEWKAGEGRVLKRPPNAVVTHHCEPEGQNEKPVGSFWTTMVEEDEQRLFTDKVNSTFSECLNLIDKGCPKEEILVTLNDLITKIPDATKLVKYWICLARIEPITSPIENIIAIYEKAILSGAQPIEELQPIIVDILTMKSQEKVKLGENIEACATKQQIQEISRGDTEPGQPETEKEHHRNVMFRDCQEGQDDNTKEPADNVKTPSAEARASCLIKYIVSNTPNLQSGKKVQFDKTDLIFKELKFLTPVRRSRRLQEKASKLPDMLKDCYPCVSSLEQLTALESETDAFVCRPKVALCGMYAETETTEKK
ncbi:cytoskeleton-associated protein 2-like [Nycticebus coucang]|uniref:cytoskeleton-associated protein 2-like n=1 Tax=Nycticebus coucang TaxID=9470 RepID=UPI00234CBFB9|nr:cytoskeleton-associated protein 2-like [Nycticebus coucang]